jgi:hypothetical protein
MMMLDEIGLRRFARRFRPVSGSAYPGGERGLSGYGTRLEGRNAEEIAGSAFPWRVGEAFSDARTSLRVPMISAA